jgi:hypothetical protein
MKNLKAKNIKKRKKIFKKVNITTGTPGSRLNYNECGQFPSK